MPLTTTQTFGLRRSLVFRGDQVSLSANNMPFNSDGIRISVKMFSLIFPPFLRFSSSNGSWLSRMLGLVYIHMPKKRVKSFEPLEFAAMLGITHIKILSNHLCSLGGLNFDLADLNF